MKEEHDITKKLSKEIIGKIEEAVKAENDDTGFSAVDCQNKYHNPWISSYLCRGCRFLYRESIFVSPECEIRDFIIRYGVELIRSGSDSSSSQNSRKALY
jgi:hypothetical protein